MTVAAHAPKYCHLSCIDLKADAGWSQSTQLLPSAERVTC